MVITGKDVLHQRSVTYIAGLASDVGTMLCEPDGSHDCSGSQYLECEMR